MREHRSESMERGDRRKSVLFFDRLNVRRREMKEARLAFDFDQEPVLPEEVNLDAEA